MSITFKQGNILDAKENVVTQQVNCMGFMNAGLAKQIKIKWPIVEKEYKKFLNQFLQTKYCLGICQLVNIGENQQIANLFAQEGYGRNSRFTNYEALYTALEHLAKTAKINNYSIAIPYGMGASLAGGNWDIVFAIISVVLKDCDVKIYSLD